MIITHLFLHCIPAAVLRHGIAMSLSSSASVSRSSRLLFSIRRRTTDCRLVHESVNRVNARIGMCHDRLPEMITVWRGLWILHGI